MNNLIVYIKNNINKYTIKLIENKKYHYLIIIIKNKTIRK